MVAALIAARSREEAAAVLTKATVNERTLTSVLGALGRERKVQECEWVYEWARDNRLLNIIHYSCYISILGKSRRWERALTVFAEMRSQGVQPNIYTYSALISACEKGGKWEEAQKVFDEMRSKDVQPNTITYNALIRAYEKGGKWEEAQKV